MVVHSATLSKNSGVRLWSQDSSHVVDYKCRTSPHKGLNVQNKNVMFIYVNTGYCIGCHTVTFCFLNTDFLKRPFTHTLNDKQTLA